MPEIKHKHSQKVELIQHFTRSNRQLKTQPEKENTTPKELAVKKPPTMQRVKSDQNCEENVIKLNLRNSHRFSSSSNCFQLNRRDSGDPDTEKRQILGNLRYLDNQNIVSTIQMLKRHAALLDEDEPYPAVKRLSTLQLLQTSSRKQILLQVTRFRRSNIRKIAKGRPLIYNWVKNNNKDIAQLHSDYKTQIIKKCTFGKNQAKILQKQNKKTGGQCLLKQKRTQGIWKQKISFLERLKRLQDLKQRGRLGFISKKRRVQSEIKQTTSASNFKTIS